MTRRFVVALCVVILTGVTAIGALQAAGVDSSSPEGARLVTRMRAAPRSMQFSGTVRVTWRNQGEAKAVTVAIADDNGSIEVESGQARVLDEGARTYFKNHLGWSSALIEPQAEDVPKADHRWKLSVQPGPSVVGRKTQLVEATRSDGTVAQKLYLDADTSLLLRREVLDARGRVQRSLEFLDLTVGTGPALHAPAGVSATKAAPLDHVPSGYEAPRTPSGYVLVARSRHPNGVELLYSDGLFTVSVLEQRGEVDWSGLPSGGVAGSVGGNDATRYAEPSADVLVWEHNGIAYTCVSDAPPDVINAMVAGFTPGRSAVDKIVDYVLGPFSWT